MKISLILTLFLILSAGLAAAQGTSCEDEYYSQYLHWVGVYDTAGEAWSVVVSQDYAFVADRDSGLVVLDVTDLQNPQEIVVMDTPGAARDLALVDNYLLIADQSAGLTIVDVSDPSSPSIENTVSIPTSWSIDITVSDGYAYIGGGGSGVHVVELSNLPNATLVGSVSTTTYVPDIAIDGDRAFVANHSDGFRVLDISFPQLPFWRAQLPMPGLTRGIAISGNHAFVALDDLGIQVVDISDPDKPQLVGTAYEGVGDPFRITVSGNRAYVADQTNGMYIVDISDPTSLSILGSTDGGWTFSSFVGRGVYVRTGPGGDDEHAFVAMTTYGLQIVDVSNPSMVETVAEFDPDPEMEMYAVGFDLVGDLVYLAVESGDLCGSSGKLRVIDVSDPTNPVARGFDDTINPFAVKVVGDLAYATEECHGLVVVDVSDPDALEVKGSVPMASGAVGLALAGSYAYVAGWEDGLHVVDVGDPVNPYIVHTADTPGVCLGVALRDPYVFVGDQVGGLRVFDVGDVSNPQNPTPITNLDLPGGNAYQMALDGDYAYVANLTGLAVVDISNPTAPFLAAYVEMPYAVTSMTLDGMMLDRGVAYVMNRDAGVTVVDLANPLQPKVVGNVDTPGSAIWSAVTEDHLFVSDVDRGLRVFRKQCIPTPTPPAPWRTLFLAAAPNPFNPRTTIEYTLASPDEVQLRIYNLAGRLVRDLAPGRQGAGHHEIQWNGTDDAGRQLASGVYLVKLTAGGATDSIPVALLK